MTVQTMKTVVIHEPGDQPSALKYWGQTQRKEKYNESYNGKQARWA